jgi:hypothetical protein
MKNIVTVEIYKNFYFVHSSMFNSSDFEVSYVYLIGYEDCQYKVDDIKELLISKASALGYNTAINFKFSKKQLKENCILYKGSAYLTNFATNLFK